MAISEMAMSHGSISEISMSILNKVECRMSNLKNAPCHFTNIFPMSIGFMSHVDFKKWPCRPVNFTQGSHMEHEKLPKSHGIL